MKVHVVSAKDWAGVSEAAHRAVFGEIRVPEMDRVDYVYFATDDDSEKTAVGYITCREVDSETVYWQFGGSFPGSKETLKVFRAYSQALELARSKYKRIQLRVLNTNVPMLRLAMKVGFTIVGVQVRGQNVLVEHSLEFS